MPIAIVPLRTIRPPRPTPIAVHREGIARNYFDAETGDEYWISGPKKNGQDRHSAGGGPVAIVVRVKY